jgi:hypothetical protein
MPEERNAEKSNLSVRQKLSRILQVDQPVQSMNTTAGTTNKGFMITKVVARPNPFFTSITLDVACIHSKHVIVRMFDEEERIIKMFSWFLVKGINVTTINEVGALTIGAYCLDIVDLEGDLLFSTQLTKGE